MGGISIYSDRCWIDNILQPATITFRHGKIEAIDFKKLPAAISYGHHVIMPGIIDPHVHVNEPGRTEWEGFNTATLAAAAGGITTIVDMPLNASPVTTTLNAFKQKLEASEGQLHVNCGFYGGLVPHHKKELEELLKEGILGVKCFLVHSGIDEFPESSRQDIVDILPFLKNANLPLLVHCELQTSPLPEWIGDAGSYKSYLQSRPREWENNAISMVIELARDYHTPIHIVHVSSSEALPGIALAKASGIPITAETCPHYIYFSSEEVHDNFTLLKCAPPIREMENNKLLKEALKSMVLDFIASDHSPSPPELKRMEDGDFIKAWGGIAGLQMMLPASWTSMKELITLEEFIPMLTSRPAEFLKLEKQKGTISLGHDADFVIWSPEEKFIVREDDIYYKHKASPYSGRQMSGMVRCTIVNGINVYQDKQIINKNAGKWVLRK